MNDLKTLFEQAAQDVNQLRKRPSNEDLLALYAFFKQASVGDCSGKRPGLLDPKGRAKYDAWDKLKGLHTRKAMEGYIAKVSELQAQDRG